MNTFFLVTGLLLVAFLIHSIIWKFRVPRNPYLALICIFLWTLLLGMMIVSLSERFQRLAPSDLWHALHVCLFYVSMSLFYVVTYSGLEADSPSGTMIKFVTLAGSDGCSRQDFSRIITDELVVKSRLQALVDGGMVVEAAGRYKLTDKGRLIERLFSLWSHVLNIPTGG